MRNSNREINVKVSRGKHATKMRYCRIVAFMFVFCMCLAIISCSGTEDNGGTNDDDGANDTGDVKGQDGELHALNPTDYQSIIDDLFNGEWRGTISDNGSDVICEFDGEAFTLNFSADEMSCFDVDDQPAECADALDARWPLHGTLSIGTDVEISISGTAYLPIQGGILSSRLATNTEPIAEEFGDALFDDITFTEELNSFYWNRSFNPQVWESCYLSIELLL